MSISQIWIAYLHTFTDILSSFETVSDQKSKAEQPIYVPSEQMLSWHTSSRTCGQDEPRLQQWQWCWTTYIQHVELWPSHHQGQQWVVGSLYRLWIDGRWKRVKKGTFSLDWNVGKHLLQNPTFEAGRTPIHKLDRSLGLDGCNGGIDILWHNVTTVQ